MRKWSIRLAGVGLFFLAVLTIQGNPAHEVAAQNEGQEKKVLAAAMALAKEAAGSD